MTPPSGEPALVIEGLVSGYGGGDVLHGVSLTVPDGGITCVVGPNGAGKSTLLATILLVEQNARAGLRLSTHGVVMENGRVRLAGTGREVLEHPEIGALYLGGAVKGTGEAGGATGGAENGDAAAS
jgi:ABC-type branched-subunit amino acid transport system ATPase component